MRQHAILLALALLSAPALTQVEIAKLVAPTGAPYVFFGWEVAMSSGRVLVGAGRDDTLFNNAGSVHLMDSRTGQHLAKWYASDAQDDARFGTYVALSPNYALVGAYRDVNGGLTTGSCYLFDLATGQELHKLIASDADQHTYHHLGLGASLTDELAVSGSAVEAAYVFDVATGQEVAILTTPDVGPDDEFGRVVAISGHRVVVGAYEDDELGTNTGSAFVFDALTGQELLKLQAADASEHDLFGAAVSIDGDRILVGAWSYNTSTYQHPGPGAAYVFDATTGQQLWKLTADDGVVGDAFGREVALFGDRALIAAASASNSVGAAYVFDVTTGQQLAKLTASDGTLGDVYGTGVALDADHAVIGAGYDDPYGSSSGSAYLYGLDPVGTSYCGPSVPNSTGLSAGIVALGTDVTQDNDLSLTAVRLPLGQFGYFLGGPSQGFVQNPGGSQGNLCLAGSIGRHTAGIFSTGTSGTGQLQLDLTDLPFPGGGHAITAGETWNWTTWFRDKNPTPTSNFTDGASIVFQ